jgi:16S rRNA (guanine527-N7)-methyltransferase
VTAGHPPPELRPSLDALPPAGREALLRLVDVIASDPTAPSSVRDPSRVWRVHVADSLTGLEFGQVESAGRIADVGAGAGFPGLVLAAALPQARVDLVESIGRKCEFMRRAIAAAGMDNARVLHVRAEELAARDEGREAYDVVTARAVGRLATLAELASPLLRDGGWLVAWKGRLDPDEQRQIEAAAPDVAVEPVEIRHVGPYAGSRHRHLHLLRKRGPTPGRLPRRPGMAKKRPFGA